MSTFPAPAAPQQPLFAFLVDAAGQPVTGAVIGSVVSSSSITATDDTGRPLTDDLGNQLSAETSGISLLGAAPQRSVPVLIVDPYTGSPLNVTSNGAAPTAFHAAAGPQQAIPIVLVDPVSGLPMTGSSVLAILAGLVGS